MARDAIEHGGWDFLASRERVLGVELDLLFRREQTLLVVEVKTTWAPLLPESNLGTTQRRRIHRVLPALLASQRPWCRAVSAVLAAVQLHRDSGGNGVQAKLRFFRLEASSRT